MGGILVVTPYSAVINVEIPKLKKLPRAKDLRSKGIIPLQYFERDPKKSMNDITFSVLPEYMICEKINS